MADSRLSSSACQALRQEIQVLRLSEVQPVDPWVHKHALCLKLTAVTQCPTTANDVPVVAHH